MNNPKAFEPTKITDATSKEQPSEKSGFWKDFLALIKIGIVNSNLMMTFAGFWLALFFTDSRFSDHWTSFILVMIGTGLVIAGGCVLNNYYDRDIDQNMSRTKKRATVTGTISPTAVLLMGIVFSALGVLTLLMINIPAALVGLFGWFVYVVLYTMWSKRRFTLNTIVGCFSGAVPPVIGWLAVDPHYHSALLVVFLIMFLWQTPHFLALAMMKVKEYKEVGIPMLPVVHGFGITKRQITIYIACLLPLPFYLSELGNIFIVIMTVLNIGWLILSFRGFFIKDDMKWARSIFIYSLNYLMVTTIAMVAATLPSLF